MKVWNTLEYSGPVLPYLRTSGEGAIRMNRLLAVIVLCEAIEESFQILRILRFLKPLQASISY